MKEKTKFYAWIVTNILVITVLVLSFIFIFNLTIKTELYSMMIAFLSLDLVIAALLCVSMFRTIKDMETIEIVLEGLMWLDRGDRNIVVCIDKQYYIVLSPFLFRYKLYCADLKGKKSFKLYKFNLKEIECPYDEDLINT